MSHPAFRELRSVFELSLSIRVPQLPRTSQLRLRQVDRSFNSKESPLIPVSGIPPRLTTGYTSIHVLVDFYRFVGEYYRNRIWLATIQVSTRYPIPGLCTKAHVAQIVASLHKKFNIRQKDCGFLAWTSAPDSGLLCAVINPEI